ncbi:MAG TPA: hypothetical protein VGP36_10470 [Mycobacteriales bacterium]|nr:hypothetical protein [Mycobacteriales bacterium]
MHAVVIGVTVLLYMAVFVGVLARAGDVGLGVEATIGAALARRLWSRR